MADKIVRIPKMEFARRYADQYSTNLQVLRAHKTVAVKCDCGSEDCVGWRMVLLQGNPILLKAVGVWSYARPRHRVTYQWHCKVCGVDGRSKVANWHYVRALALDHFKNNHWLEDR